MSLSITAHMSLRDAAMVWHVVLDRAVEGVSVQWGRVTFPMAVEWLPSYGTGKKLVQPFFLPLEDPQIGALALSASYGLRAGHLWRCLECHQPFLRGANDLRSKRCAPCRRRRARARAATEGLSGTIAAEMQVLTKRLKQRVRRTLVAPKIRRTAPLSPEECDRKLRRAKHYALLVQAGKKTLSDWTAKHDEKKNPGRPKERE
jgi:hypothetical protein